MNRKERRAAKLTTPTPAAPPMDRELRRVLAAGTRHHAAGRLDQAAASYTAATAVAPGAPEPYYNLGVVLRQLGKPAAAAAAYRKAITLNPKLRDAHNNLGNALRELGRLDEALAAYRKALAIGPPDAEILCNLGVVLDELLKPDEALSAYRKAAALDPNNALAAISLAFARRRQCDWRDIEQDETTCRAFVRAGTKGILPFDLFAFGAPAEEQLACARLYALERTSGIEPFAAPAPRSRGKIRLAYLSGDFRAHPTAWLTAELFERHDRSRFDVTAYSFGADDGSAIRRRLERGFDRFVDIRGLSHGDAAQRIRDDGIDILVDLMGHTTGARQPVLARRPAPIQVNFLVYPGTIGADYIDYIVADRTIVPASDAAFFSERIVHLPYSYQPTDTRRETAERTPSRAECGLPRAGFVFCSFNNSYKITPGVFDIWMRLMRAVPGSVLWLLEVSAAERGNLAREAQARGVARERLVFAPRVSQAEHLARHRLADLFLDNLPYNAHTTASDALWMGLPVVTCIGETFVGRVAASLLRAVNLPELVTNSLADYEALALRLAGDPAFLGGLRLKLQANRLTAPLFDTKRYARYIEAAYLRMWEGWTAGRPPEPFAVAP